MPEMGQVLVAGAAVDVEQHLRGTGWLAPVSTSRLPGVIAPSAGVLVVSAARAALVAAQLAHDHHPELQPAQDGKPQYFYFMGRQDMALDYWHDEGAQPG